ncbi:MAG: translation initiation factor IF-2 [Candidatus Makana argininalis]
MNIKNNMEDKNFKKKKSLNLNIKKTIKKKINIINKKNIVKIKNNFKKINQFKEKKNNNKYINTQKNNKININQYINNKKSLYSQFDLKYNIAINNNHEKNKKKKKIIQKFIKPLRSNIKNIYIGKFIKLHELANKIAVKKFNLINLINKLELKININHIIDKYTAYLLAEEMGYNIFSKDFNKIKKNNLEYLNKNISITYRMPIVTIMGHVDHGKTSILKYILKNTVLIKEKFGITQHLGFYNVKTECGRITFLDTPGHLAFNYVRSKGAKLTDIILLVIAADDGVMPQTIEAIQHAKNFKVPIIVVINKIDKLESNINKIKNDLTKYNIVSEKWGGKNKFINVSAKVGTGIDKLIDVIILQSKLLDLKTKKYGNAKGVIVESFLDKNLGPVSIIIVKEGVLNKNDIILCGLEYGKIRSMYNLNNENIEKSKLSLPIKIIGLSGITKPGDEFKVIKDEKKAKHLSIIRKTKSKEIKLCKTHKYNLENIFKQISNKINNKINLIIKADVNGSCEAIRYALNIISKKNIKINIIKSSIGEITENDVMLAYTSNSIILCFNVISDIYVKRLIKFKKIDVRYYISIYDLIKEVKKIIEKMNNNNIKEKIIGKAEVKNIFNSKKLGLIAGCIVNQGIIKKNKKIIILRKNKIVYKGILESLKRFKNDVFEIKKGIECGISMNKYKDISLGDIVEVFE